MVLCGGALVFYCFSKVEAVGGMGALDKVFQHFKIIVSAKLFKFLKTFIF